MSLEGKIKNQTNMLFKLEKKNQDLERRLKIAVEALEKCNVIANYKNAFNYSGDVTKVTYEALNKIKEQSDG